LLFIFKMICSCSSRQRRCVHWRYTTRCLAQSHQPTFSNSITFCISIASLN